MQNRHRVVVILESGSGEELKSEFLKVKKLSEQEATCMEYHVHQDIDNPKRFFMRTGRAKKVIQSSFKSHILLSFVKN